MYALSSLCYIYKNFECSYEDLERIEKAREKEKAKKVCIAYDVLLYQITKDMSYIEKVLRYLDDENYHIRCNVINLLSGVIDQKNVIIIQEAYKNRLRKEQMRAVWSSLKEYVDSSEDEIK